MRSRLTPLRRRAGMTLIEIIVAGSILLLLSVAVITAFIFLLKVEGSVLANMSWHSQNSKAYQLLMREVLNADLILEKRSGSLPEGTRIEIIKSGQSTKAFYIDDSDNNLATIEDNVLMFDPNINAGGNERVVARQIGTLSGSKIFEYPSATSPLRVRARIGSHDPLSTTRIKGLGYQNAIIDTAFAVRITTR